MIFGTLIPNKNLIIFSFIQYCHVHLYRVQGGTMDNNLKVIDLVCGIGGRSKAFVKAGFDVVCAIDNDIECKKLYSEMLGDNNFIYGDLSEISPEKLPNADLIAGKIIHQPFSFSGNKRREISTIMQNSTNKGIYNIICYKLPKIFLLEAPSVILTKNRGEEFKYILENYEKIGYKIMYHVFNERDYSGYPVMGKQLFIIGIRKIIEREEYYFPEPQYLRSSNMLNVIETINIDDWYRKISKSEDVYFEKGKYYLREKGKIYQTDIIHMGMYREMFLVDDYGPRKFTHNELATLKGLADYDFNKCSNKQRMYMRIAYSSNVYVVEMIAASIKKYFEEKENFDDEFNPNSMIAKVKYQKKILTPNVTKDVLFPKHKIESIHIDNLKGIKNLDISINKNLVAIMGVNGCGKSTILHALACMYSPYDNGNNYKFSFFFTPNPDATWKNSKLSISYFDENTQKIVMREYKKDADRWSPRYENRPKRDVYFIGIESCIPEIEIEKQTSFIDYSTNAASDELSRKIIQAAADILNKDYKSLTYHKTKKKELLGVYTLGNIRYSSLSMGAGEQRVIKILKLAYTAKTYSLILIDEIDLLLHVTALKRLIKTLSGIAIKRNLQIIFTTHSLEMNTLKEYVDIRYLDNLKEKTIVYDSINTDLIYDLSDCVEKPLEIYVEDLLSETLIKHIAENLNLLSSIKVRKYGAARNAFVLAAGLVLKGEDYKNVLIVLDGDVFVAMEEKVEAIKKTLSGTEKDHMDKVTHAASFIKEFILPTGVEPEKFIYDMLVEMDDDNEIIKAARKLKAVSDSHQWLDRLVERMGQSEELILHSIIDLVADNSRWDNYIKEIRQWLINKREEICRI